MSTKRISINTPSLLHVLILFLSVLFLYWSSFDDQPVFDAISFLDQTTLRHHFESYFQSGLFTGLKTIFMSQRGLSIAFITLAAHFLGYSTTLFHVLTALFHIANCILFYVVFLQGLQHFNSNSAQSQNTSNTFALLTTLLIAVHPAAVYACAYTAQITILMATFWTLIFALCFFRMMQKPNLKRGLFLLLIYILIIQSKETAIMVPFAFGALLFSDRFNSKNKIPILIFLAACFLIAAFYTLQSLHLLGQTYEAWSGRMQLITNPQAMDSGRPESLQGDFTYARSILNQMFLFGRYGLVWLLPLPHFLAIDIPTVFPAKLLTVQNLMGMIGFTLYPIVLILLYRKHKVSTFQFFCLLFPWICFFTELSVVRFHESYVLYRSYLWMPFGLLGSMQFVPQSKRNTQLTKIVLTVVLIVFAIITHFRLRTFETHTAVWQDAADKINLTDKNNKSAYRAFLFLGGLQVISGNHDSGIKNIQTAISFDDSAYLSHYNLGLAFLQTNRFPEAVNAFQRASELAPQDRPSLYNLANAHLYNKSIPEAIATYSKLLSLEPEHVDAHHNLAIAYSQSGNFTQSIEHYRRVLELNPQHQKVQYNFANALMLNNQVTEAIEHYKKALAIDPNSFVTHYNVALAYLKTNDRIQAVNHLNAVIKLNPQFTAAQKILESLTSAPNQ